MKHQKIRLRIYFYATRNPSASCSVVLSKIRLQQQGLWHLPKQRTTRCNFLKFSRKHLHQIYSNFITPPTMGKLLTPVFFPHRSPPALIETIFVVTSWRLVIHRFIKLVVVHCLRQVCLKFMASQPTPPRCTTPRNEGFIAGLIKRNQRGWLTSHDESGRPSLGQKKASPKTWDAGNFGDRVFWVIIL